jgi:pimeloyl-ACP methyl ester carboxylesterase
MLFVTVVVVCAGAAAQSKYAGAHESRVPVQGAGLYCREVGQGVPMIVLHGGPDFDLSYLLPELDGLSDKFHLIYYDQRGRGRSADDVKPEDVTLESETRCLTVRPTLRELSKNKGNSGRPGGS